MFIRAHSREWYSVLVASAPEFGNKWISRVGIVPCVVGIAGENPSGVLLHYLEAHHGPLGFTQSGIDVVVERRSIIILGPDKVHTVSIENGEPGLV